MPSCEWVSGWLPNVAEGISQRIGKDGHRPDSVLVVVGPCRRCIAPHVGLCYGPTVTRAAAPCLTVAQLLAAAQRLAEMALDAPDLDLGPEERAALQNVRDRVPRMRGNVEDAFAAASRDTSLGVSR